MATRPFFLPISPSRHVYFSSIKLFCLLNLSHSFHSVFFHMVFPHVLFRFLSFPLCPFLLSHTLSRLFFPSSPPHLHPFPFCLDFRSLLSKDLPSCNISPAPVIQSLPFLHPFPSSFSYLYIKQSFPSSLPTTSPFRPIPPLLQRFLSSLFSTLLAFPIPPPFPSFLPVPVSLFLPIVPVRLRASSVSLRRLI